jgi:predicted RNA-binding Zn-ribbon protein involved in translation (DUF1610 family)
LVTLHAVVPKLSTVFSQAQHKLRERDFTATCEQCGLERSIAHCNTTAQDGLRRYSCFACGDLLVLVGKPADRPISGDSCRPGEWWSIRPTSELFVSLGQSRLKIAALPRTALIGQFN